jgi:hypothetical protein
MKARFYLFAATLLGASLAACSNPGALPGQSAAPDQNAPRLRAASNLPASPSAKRRRQISGNLLVNGDAETGNATASGYDAVTIPGWQTQGLPTVVAYGDPGGFPSATTPGPPSRGKNFFAGGALGNSSLTQSIDVSKAAAAIDAGGVTSELSGWLGGYGSQKDNAQVIATYYNASGTSLGTSRIGPVTPSERSNATKLLYRSSQASVPVGTRSIGVVLENTVSTGYDDGYADDLSLTLSTAIATPPAPTPPPAHVPAISHVYEIMMENEWYPEIVGNTAQAPYINSLIAQGSVLSNMFAVTHPSDPNYVAIAAGSTYGLDANAWSTTTIAQSHLADLIENSGRSWKVYMESANGPCDQTLHGYYYPDDSPYLYFADVRNNATRCQSHIVPIANMTSDFSSSTTTPDYAWIAPDDCDDMEQCGITAGDAWLSNTIPIILNSPSWKAGNSIIIVTWDEDDRAHNQNVPCFIIGPGVKAGYVSNAPYTHYSVLKTIEAAFGLPALTLNDSFANPINDVWQ